jgi:FecR protein
MEFTHAGALTGPGRNMKIEISSFQGAHLVACRSNLMVASLLGLAALLGASPAQADPLAVVGILQGTAVLVRQTTRYTLVEGAALSEGDIVETAPGAFAQIEFEDGAIIGVGESSQVIVKPKLVGLKTTVAPRLYLLEGWVKAAPPPKAPTEVVVLCPRFEAGTRGGAVVVHLDAKGYALFGEGAGAWLAQRDAPRATVALKGGEFASVARLADKPAVTPRMSAEFLQQLPKMYRDALPPRAALYANRYPVLKPLGPIDYGDVKAWMHSEPGIRLALSKQWRSRASDRAFRADLVTNLSAHMEWERVLFPERFLPKKPPVPQPPPRPASAPTESASSPAIR